MAQVLLKHLACISMVQERVPLHGIKKGSFNREHASMCRKWTEELSGITSKAMSHRSQPRHILYPYAGYDLASAVAAFRDADVYIMIDDHSFIAPDRLTERICFMSGYRYAPSSELVSEITGRYLRARGMLPLILGKMHVFHPEFNVRGIQYFIQPAPTNYAVHGILDFDLGERARLKRAVFLNYNIYTDGMPLQMDFVDGMLVRGAMTCLTKPSVFKDVAIEAIKTNKGVVIEGYNMIGVQGYEFWQSDDEIPSEPQIDVSNHFQLSYRKGTRIVSFE